MARVKRGTTANKRRKNLLEHTKGFKWGRKSKYRAAKQAFMKAQTYAFRDRKVKKRVNRRLWELQINAGCRANGTTYSKLINALTKSKIEINRKILSEILIKKPEVFKEILKAAGIK